MSPTYNVERARIDRGDFKTIDEHIDALAGWEGEISQLESGLYSSQQLVLSAGHFQYMFFSQSRKVLNRGQAHAGGFQFCIPLIDRLQPRYLHYHIDGPAICCVPPGQTIDVVMPPGFEGVTLFIDTAYFHQLLQRLGDRPLCSPVRDDLCFYYPSRAQYRGLCQLLTVLFDGCRAQTALSHTFEAWMRVITECHVIPRLLTIMASSGTGPVKHRPQLFRKALDQMLNDLDETPSIGELASLLGTTERNLQYLFKNNLGMSPKQFAKLYRLNVARRHLWQSGQGRGTVSDIANRLGYWHMGGFARDFRALFEVTPRDLLTVRYTVPQEKPERAPEA